MKKNTNNVETILNYAMNAATSPSEAWRMGDQYFLATEEEAYKKIKAEALRLVAHEDEIVEAVDYALHIHNEEPKNNAQHKLQVENDWQSVIARLESQSGIPAEHWVWGAAQEYTRRAYRDLTIFAAACGGRKAERMKDELDYAMNELARLRAEIVRRVTEEREAKKGVVDSEEHS
jgi:hypothetical protein